MQTFSGATIGTRSTRPVSEGSSSSASPIAIASGMPWMCPLGEVDGVLISGWVSNQITPSLVQARAAPAIVPIAIA